MEKKDHTIRNILIGVGVGFAAAYLMKKENREKVLQVSKDTKEVILDKVEEVKSNPGVVTDMVMDRMEHISGLIESISEDIDTFRNRLD